MVRAFFDPQHPRGSRHRRTPPPEGKAPCCSCCKIYLLCRHGHIPLEIIRELDDNFPRHKVRVRPKQVYGKKILYIREYRKETGASLRDAKDHVEAGFDRAVKWYYLPNDCPRFGPYSSFWDEEGATV